MPELNSHDGAVCNLGKLAEQIDYLAFHFEIRSARIGPTIITAAKPCDADHPDRSIWDWKPLLNSQVLDPAELILLHQSYEP